MENKVQSEPEYLIVTLATISTTRWGVKATMKEGESRFDFLRRVEAYAKGQWEDGDETSFDGEAINSDPTVLNIEYAEDSFDKEKIDDMDETAEAWEELKKGEIG